MADFDCFISYASEDLVRAQILYRRLREVGLRPWMDKPPKPYILDGLKPGENWEDRLREVIESCNYFVALFSENSVEKIGYVQSEFRQALNRLSKVPAGKTFVIPVRLEKCEIPKTRVDGISFSQYQYIDCFCADFETLVTHLASLEGIPTESYQETSVDAEVAQEFLAKLKPHTKMKLIKGFSLTDIGLPDNPHLYAQEVFDGEEIIFQNLQRIELVGSADKPVEIIVSPRYATVMTFNRSSNVVIDNLTLGHSPEQGECAGGVLKFEDCQSVEVKNCKLFGCGTYGLELINCEFVRLVDCDIYDCTYGFLTASDVSSLRIIGCRIYNNQYFDGVSVNNTDVIFENCSIFNNTPRSEHSEYFKEYRSEITFLSTTIDGEEAVDN